MTKLIEKLGNKAILIAGDIIGALMVWIGVNNDILMAICGLALVATAMLYCWFDDHCSEEDE